MRQMQFSLAGPVKMEGECRESGWTRVPWKSQTLNPTAIFECGDAVPAGMVANRPRGWATAPIRAVGVFHMAQDHGPAHL
jgi:hypothetical protein